MSNTSYTRQAAALRAQNLAQAPGAAPRLPQAIRTLKETDCVARQGRPSRAAG